MPDPNYRPPTNLRLPRGQRRLVYTVVALVAGSGIAWLVAHFALAPPADAAAAEHPLARWALMLHGVTAYGLLLLAGSAWPLHMRLAWRLRRNRLTGIAMATLLSVLALSGLCLYYAPIDWRDAASLLHWALGLLLVPLLWLHVARGRSARPRA